MSQDNLLTMKCSSCSNLNYRTTKNKRKHPEKLSLNKHCPTCGKHTEHKETKKFMKKK